MAPPPRRPPELIEEIVEEVLLRFPPDDPASLVRAALVSKRWCRLISGRGFRRRFRELHRAAPLLGFVCNVGCNLDAESPDNARFVPTSSCLPRADRREWRALDARHGRILLYHCAARDDGGHLYRVDSLEPFVVWDPITGAQLQLPHLPREPVLTWPVSFNFNAMVLCADGGACDNLDCHGGNFIVVFVGRYHDGMLAFVYSSEAGAWSEPTIAQYPDDYVSLVPAALVGNSVYFVLSSGTRILKYDLGKREMSLMIDIPFPSTSYRRIILMTTDEGRLGFIRADEFKLYLWSMEVGPQGDAVWTQDRVIELRNLLPAAALLSSPNVAGYANGLCVIVIGTEDGFFTIDTKKSNKAVKVGEGIAAFIKDGHYFYTVVPYTCFYFPALQAAFVSEGPSVGASRE